MMEQEGHQHPVYPAIRTPFPWQLRQWQQCLDKIAQKRLPHALALTGPRGTGKMHFARSLACYLMCDEPVGINNCGKCRNCVLNSYGTHPDLLSVVPESSNNILIEQIRFLCEQLNITAHQKGWRVALIAPAEMMNHSAANALLKQLEEPGEMTLFVLIAHEANRLMPTVRSRCQNLYFPVPESSEVLPWLGRQEASVDNTEELLKLARGKPLRALESAAADSFDAAKLLDDWHRLLDDDLSAEELSLEWNPPKNPEHCQEALQWLADWLQDCLYYLTTGGAHPLTSTSHRTRLSETTGRLNQEQLHRLSLLVLHSCRALSDGSNPNRTLLLEKLFATVQIISTRQMMRSDG